MTRNTLSRTLGVFFALIFATAACGSDSAADSDDAAGTSTGTSGEIVISGSSTVEPISVVVAESFRDLAPGVNISVSGPGTGDGFKLFCAGDTDISDASRQIKDSEAEDCAANGIDYVELKVAVDGIAVLTSHENTDVACLAFGDLYGLVGPESAGITTWEDANAIAGDAGGNGGLPNADLVISAPGTESGTYDSFIEIALEDIADERGQEATTRPDYSSAADDNLIIETISSNPTSFGWVGFAFAAEAGDQVRMIPVATEAGGECVEPTPETIASNEYPIARDLFIYVNVGNAAANPSLVDFVDHYVGFGLDTAAADVGYVALSDDSKTATRDAWASRSA